MTSFGYSAMLWPMKSPFPGMDPYLETRWEGVHQTLTIYARDAIQPRLHRPFISSVAHAKVQMPHWVLAKSVIGETYCRNYRGASTNGCRVWRKKVWSARTLSLHVLDLPSKYFPVTRV